MSVRNQLKLLVGGLNARRTGRTLPPHSAAREFFDRSRVVAMLITEGSSGRAAQPSC